MRRSLLGNARLHRGRGRSRPAARAIGKLVGVAHRPRRGGFADPEVGSDTHGDVGGDESGKDHGPGAAQRPAIAAIGVRHRQRRCGSRNHDVHRERPHWHRRQFHGEPREVASEGAGELFGVAGEEEGRREQQRGVGCAAEAADAGH